MKIQWFRCAIGLHKNDIHSKEKVFNVRNEEVGTNYILRCENCGRIHSKFISIMIEEIRRY